MAVRVRITEKPREKELDGIPLGRFSPGSIREVPAALGSWLIAQGYAEPEMRHPPKEDLDFSPDVKPARSIANDRPHRRSTDR
jgi:hypothetical protein